MMDYKKKVKNSSQPPPIDHTGKSNIVSSKKGGMFKLSKTRLVYGDYFITKGLVGHYYRLTVTWGEQRL